MNAFRDVPDGHAAHSAVKTCAKSKRAFFEVKRADGKLRLQLTQNNAGGSLTEAARLCRLVHLKLEENPSMTKEEANKYRDDLAKQLRTAIEGEVDQRPLPGLTHDAPIDLPATAASTQKKRRKKLDDKSLVPDKLTFHKLAPSWAIQGCGIYDLQAPPCQFISKGTLGWEVSSDCVVSLNGLPLRCNVLVRGTLFNSADWPDFPGSSSSLGNATSNNVPACTETAENLAEHAAAARPTRKSTRRVPFQEEPPEIAGLLGCDDWEKQWCDFASSAHTSLTIGPWGEITLVPKVFEKSLGWQARRMKGRPAAHGKKLRGNGGLPCGFAWNGAEFVAPCQIHIWLSVQSSKQWLYPEPDNTAAEMEHEMSSEDEAEQAELEVALDDLVFNQQGSLQQDFMHSDTGDDPYCLAESEEQINRPQNRMFRVRRSQEISTCSRFRPARAHIVRFHTWFKSMNAETFFDRIQEAPDYLRKYTEHAARLETFDAPEDRVVERVAYILEALPMPPGGSPLKVVDLGSGEACLASRLQTDSSAIFEVTNVDAIPFTDTTQVHNLVSLPKSWSGIFDVAVLSRALWARDYMKVLHEAKRVLIANHSSRLVICEPFRRWFGRDKRRPDRNALTWMVQRAGFSIEWSRSSGTEPFHEVEEQTSMKVEHALFQYIVARLEPDRCVLCTRLPARRYPRGLRLCMNCEEDDAGLRPERERLEVLDWRPQWAVDWAAELNEKHRSHRSPRSRSHRKEIRSRSPRGHHADARQLRKRRRWNIEEESSTIGAQPARVGRSGDLSSDLNRPLSDLIQGQHGSCSAQHNAHADFDTISSKLDRPLCDFTKGQHGRYRSLAEFGGSSRFSMEYRGHSSSSSRLSSHYKSRDRHRSDADNRRPKHYHQYQ
jgi:hypothetical protein